MVEQVIDVKRRFQRYPLYYGKCPLHAGRRAIHTHLTYSIHTGRKDTEVVSRRLARRIRNKTISAKATEPPGELLGISPNGPLPNQVVSTADRILPGENESGHR